jgi:hypothetical protein
MFKLTPDPKFKAKVLLTVPGKEKRVEISVTFNHKPKSQLQSYYESLKDRKDDDSLLEIIAGWDGVDAEFSAEALQQLLANYPASAGELFEAYRINLIDSRKGN